MPRNKWRPLEEVAQTLPGRLPLMVAPRGRNRHLPAALHNQIMPLPAALNNQILPVPLEDEIQEDNHALGHHDPAAPVDGVVVEDDNQQDDDLDNHDPAAPVEDVVVEVALEGTSLQEELKFVQQKIKDTVESEDRTIQTLRKLGRGRKYLEKAIFEEEFEQLPE